MKNIFLLLCMILSPITLSARKHTVTLKWLHTSDVHGALFAYDFLTRQPTPGGLSSFYAYSQRLKQKWGERLILTDGGDCLQGQPTAYYHNYIQTAKPHLVASMMNEIGYVAGAMGNHDIETGHEVYDRWRKQLNFPLLGANVIDTRTGEPYLRPYMVIEREGVRIAILGMLTPGIPNWLPEVLWEGLRFEEMTSSARKWLKIIKEKEHPDLVIGLFHSGLEAGIVTDEYRENATLQVAQEVPGFDIIFYGHDHRSSVRAVQGADGSTTYCMGPSSLATCCVEADIKLTVQDGKVVAKHITGRLPKMTYADAPAAHLYEMQFAEQRDELTEWLSQPIGQLTCDLHERDAFFGSSRFIDFIHQMQLELTGAQISFAAPVSFDSHILKGQLTVSDMFSLYKYENFLYTMRLTGREIKGFLEMSYGLWTDQMKSPSDHCILLDYILDGGKRLGLKNLAYNMESAAGILYTVDVTKPVGERIHISSMADGTPFDLDHDYLVAINSYRGNGGGELLTRGAGIPHGQLRQRLVKSSDKDLRYYFMELIRQKGTVSPEALHHWRFVPEEWTHDALLRDRDIIFPANGEVERQH